MDIDAGSLVSSVAGRDKGRVFVVVGIENGYCLICDGKIRKSDKPKRKKLKHIEPTGLVSEALKNKIALGERLTNSEVRRGIAAFYEEPIN